MIKKDTETVAFLIKIKPSKECVCLCNYSVFSQLKCHEHVLEKCLRDLIGVGV